MPEQNSGLNSDRNNHEINKKALTSYAKKNGLLGLSKPSIIALMENKQGYDIAKAQQFLQFQQRINKEMLQHPVITQNLFTLWFQQGNMNEQQVRLFIVQFSVFSNLFLIAQTHKMINADSLEGMRASKEILANEIGVVFKPPRRNKLNSPTDAEETEAKLVSTEGTIEGGTFRYRAAHFEWLLDMAIKLNLQFEDLGTRRHGTESTLFFCDELSRLYGSENYLISQSASYAVENWAAAGFWDELVDGFNIFNGHSAIKLPIAFFTWHSRIEAQHALHTQEELEELYFSRPIDEDDFIKYGYEMLDGVAAFWNGLDQQRKQAA
jgi:hypothetical protein